MNLRKNIYLIGILAFSLFLFCKCSGKTNSTSIVDSASSIQMKSGAATSSEMMTDTTMIDLTATKPAKH